MARTSLDKDRIGFLLLEGVHDAAVCELAAAGYTKVTSLPGSLPEDELIARLADARFLGIRSRTRLTRRVLESAPRLVAVGCFCIGTDQVDLGAASEHGVAVFNAPFSNTRSVAELVVAEAILLLRGVPARNAGCHRGAWLKTAGDAHEVRGKTLGIVGYGAIGSQVSVLAEALGMHVLFHDIEPKLPLGNARPAVSLGEVLDAADVLTLHVPDTPETRGLVGAAEIARLRPGSVLLNASRGTVVDLDALADALRGGHLAGAAVDVFPAEPRGAGEEFTSPLRGLDNALLTPHIGGSTVEAQANIGSEVARKLVMYSDNGTTTASVNFPEVALPGHPGAHRLLHVHRNVPGILSRVNRVFSEGGINVAAQYLQTRGPLGYVVVDCDAASSEAALQELRNIEGTLRCRVLF